MNFFVKNLVILTDLLLITYR